MTIRRTYSLIAIAALLVCFAVIFFYNRRPGEKQVYIYAEPFRSGTGWGYNVLADGKVHIHQPFIPAVPGRQEFKTEEDALKVGRLVVKKITENRSPTVTLLELDSMGLFHDTLVHKNVP
jgi:Domain of unknown function (DUF4907)